MNRIFIFISSLFIGYFTMGFYLSQYEFKLIGKKLKNETLQTSYKVHQNIYTDLTIGSGNLSTILEAAKANNSQYLILTDLNPTLELDSDFYSFNTGVLHGAKLTSEDYSATFYTANRKNYKAQDEFKNLNNIEDRLIISHIDAQKKIFPGADGLDVVNLKNLSYRVWIKKKLSTIWSIIFYPFNPKIALIRLFRDPEDELLLFDKMSQERKINMYLATEATAKAIPIANWLIKFPSYENVLSIASERVLLNSEVTYDIAQDQKSILTALKKGSHFITMDTFGDAAGFEAYAHSTNKKKYCFMGDECKAESSLRLYYKLPIEPFSFFEVVLYKNGQRIDHRNVARGDFPLNEKGVYRLQIRLNTDLPFPDNNKWLTWIFTNNFYIK